MRKFSRDFLSGGAFQKFVDESLVGFRLLGGQAAELAEKARGNADGNQLLGFAGYRASQWPREYRKGSARYPAYAWRSLRVAWRALMMRIVSFSFLSLRIV